MATYLLEQRPYSVPQVVSRVVAFDLGAVGVAVVYRL